MSSALPLTNDVFPFINACLNSLTTILLLLGYVMVKRRQLIAHEKLMWAAFGTSAAFLASYLYYHFNYTSQKYTGTGWLRPVYFTILLTHVILAVANLPFILRLLWLAVKKDYVRHARLARKVWPLWMYVSVTGVVIYLMLYT